MTLGGLLDGWVDAGAAAAMDLAGLTADSRQVEPGDLFVALPYLNRAGFKHDGHDYVAQAVERGAAAVLATDGERARAAAGAAVVLVAADTRWLLPRLAARWYGEASEQLALVGVTGTNGKTTTCYLLDDILVANGQRTVLAGTIETRVAGLAREATTTTPDPVSLQRLWREAVDQGVTTGSMEVSSHALDQHRVDATRYRVAVFTNLTQDHLDYHGDLEDYFAAKRRLFAPDESGRAPYAVIGGDDPYGQRLLAALPGAVSFGLSAECQVRAEQVAFDHQGSQFEAVTPVGRWTQRLAMVAPYNVVNALGALAAALALGVPVEVVRAALTSARGAPGRLERVDAGQDFGVLVDYAHTPDALANALRAVRALTSGRVICVFGCGGDRDRTKRPRMMAIASELSDLVVVTSDNPRTEAPEAIIADILAESAAQHTPRLVEVDRATAIEQALGAAGAGDVVLIAGKGHETYQIHGEHKHHFDDREIAREWLQRHG